MSIITKTVGKKKTLLIKNENIQREKQVISIYTLRNS